MRHTETMQHEAQPGAGHFFWATTGGFLLTPAFPLAIGCLPLTLPSPLWREGETAA